MKTVFQASLAVLALSAVSAVAQYAYPAKGQSPEQQKKDEATCNSWAIDQTKYDPANPPPAPAAAAPAPVTGSGTRARGAAAGAIIGGATGGDAGDSAVAGAVVGGVVQRNRNRQAAAQQNQTAAQNSQAGLAAYNKARGACLEGKGYTVK